MVIVLQGEYKQDHHFYFHGPFEVLLGDLRAFWVARCTRCVHQHAGLVHRLVPNTFLLLKLYITIPILLPLLYYPKHTLPIITLELLVILTVNT